MDSSDLLGTAEVAQLGRVSSAAVANWRTRGLIRPVVVLACGPIYNTSAIRAFLDTTGRGDVSKVAGRSAYASLTSVRLQVRSELIAQARSFESLLLCEEMARPPRKLSGDGCGNGRGEWDWYYRLSSEERSHLSRKYLRGSLSPDRWAHAVSSLTGSSDVETCVAQWLDAVRLVDAVECVLRGRAPRFGDVLSAEGYDVAALFGANGASYLASMFEEQLDRATDRYAFTDVSDVVELEEVF